MFRNPKINDQAIPAVGLVLAKSVGCRRGRGAGNVLRRSLNLLGIIAALTFPIRAPALQMKQAALMTDWAQLVDTNAPLPEYPRPQMVKTNWLNLNGIWQFQPGATNDPVPTNQVLAREIL